jgi:hypothetical protein
VIFGVYNSVSVIITVLKSVTRKHLVTAEDFYVCCGYSDNWRVWFRTELQPSQRHTATDGQSICKPWCWAPSGDQIFITLKVTLLFFWGALSDKRTGLPFIYAAGPHQRSLSRVWVSGDSWQYFTVSDLRLPFSSPPTTRRVTVEVFKPTSTQVRTAAPFNSSERTPWKTPSPIVVDACLPLCCLKILYLCTFAWQKPHRKHFPFYCWALSVFT